MFLFCVTSHMLKHSAAAEDLVCVVDATNHSGDYRPISIKINSVGGINIAQQLLSRLLTARATSADVNLPHHSTTTHPVHQRTQKPGELINMWCSTRDVCGDPIYWLKYFHSTQILYAFEFVHTFVLHVCSFQQFHARQT